MKTGEEEVRWKYYNYLSEACRMDRAVACRGPHHVKRRGAINRQSEGTAAHVINQTVIADLPQPQRAISNFVDNSIPGVDVAFPQTFGIVDPVRI